MKLHVAKSMIHLHFGDGKITSRQLADIGVNRGLAKRLKHAGILEQLGTHDTRTYQLRVAPDNPSRGSYRGAGIIVRDADDTYAILHELGHMLTCEYGCCREHDEFMAHGFAIGFGRLLGYDFTDDESHDSMSGYVGYSERCPRKEGASEQFA